MVEKVNPPPHVRIPRKYTSDPAVADYHSAIGRILFQMWTRIGGGDDPIDANENRTPSLFTFDTNPQPYTHEISADYTTIGDEHLRVTAACTITFNATPDDGETVTVENINGSRIIIDGGSNTISGQDKIISLRKYTLLVFTYRVDLGEWVLG